MTNRTSGLRVLYVALFMLTLAIACMAREQLPTTIDQKLAVGQTTSITHFFKAGLARVATVGDGLMMINVSGPNTNLKSGTSNAPICDWKVQTPGNYTVSLRNSDTRIVSYTMVLTPNN